MLGIIVNDAEQLRVDSHITKVKSKLVAKLRAQPFAALLRNIEPKSIGNLHAAQHDLRSRGQSAMDAT